MTRVGTFNRSLLTELDQDLDQKDVQKLKYLVRDKVTQHKLLNCSSALEVFSEIEDAVDDLDQVMTCVEECLYLMDHQKLATDVGFDLTLVKRRIENKECFLPQLRIALFRVTQQLNDSDDLNSLKKAMKVKYPKLVNEMANVTSVYDLFNILEDTCRMKLNGCYDLINLLKDIKRNRLIELLNDFKGGDATIYSMTTGCKGICMIINNEKFLQTSNLKDRIGSNYDAADLKKIFEHFGLKVILKQDLKGDEMLLAVEFLSQEDHSLFSVCVVCLLSHGEENAVFGTDGQSVKLLNLTSCFTKSRCITLSGKPKLFFVQACQGELEQRAPNNVNGMNVVGNASSDVSYLPPTEENSCPNALPPEEDFLLGYSTTPGYVSFRDTASGSYYIQTLTKIFIQNAEREDVHSMLTMVIKELAKLDIQVDGASGSINKQCPMILHSLTKKLYFFPEQP